MIKQKGDLRVLFWNIKHWSLHNGDVPARERFDRILSILRKEKPDVALFAEVIDPALKTELVKSLKPAHVAFETADKNQHSLMAVFNAAAVGAVTVEQRNDFSDDGLTQRTFPLLRLEDKKHGPLAILAAHTKSGSTNENFRKRTVQFGQIAKLAVDIHHQNSALLVLGDMNSMGDSDQISGPREVKIMERIISKGDLRVLPKDHSVTWHGTDDDAKYADANLDHVFLSRAAVPRAPTVRVGGWVKETTDQARDNWVRDHSDHAYLVVDIKPRP